MIRVAQIIGKWHGGGVEAVVMNYYRHVDRSKVQFDFFCDSDSTCIPYEEINKLGGRVIIIPPYQKIFRYLNELKKLFKNNEYKIVHSHISTLSVFPLYAAKKAGVPVRIAHSHSTSNKKEWKKNILKNLLRPFSKKYATDYFCCSELAGRYLFGSRCYDDGKVFLLKNAIDVNRFQFNSDIRNLKRKELEINEDTLIIGHVGRFVTQKNHSFLIEIFSELLKIHSNSKLLLVGKGPLFDEINRKVDGLNISDKVIFLGQRADVNELYQAFDAVILPSLYEGLVVVLVEAQCAGLPCLSSTEISNETQITENLKLISLKESASEWAKEILNLYTNHKRCQTLNKLNQSGYNINIEAIKLEKFYLEKQNCNKNTIL